MLSRKKYILHNYPTQWDLSYFAIVSIKKDNIENHNEVCDYYGVSKDEIEWISCREELHYFDPPILNRLLFYYSNKNIKIKKVANFINKLEKKLKVKPSRIDRVKCKNQVLPRCLCIKVSRWWTQSQLRITFFTIALRSALSKLSINNAILNSQYMYDENIKYAVKKFLNGYTKIKKNINFNNWAENFEYAETEEIDKELVK